MSTSTLPNIRVSSDLTVRLKLKDGGVAVDWTTLTNIRASIFSDAQRAKAGRCDVSVDETDHTVLVCEYSANKPQYLGVNRVIVSCTYEEETKTYDKPAFNFVRWTDDQAGQQITIDDPDVDVEIEVEDISSSILQEAVDDAFAAADRANDAAAAAEHMVDIHTGPAGKSPYIGENGHWYEWDETAQEYVDTETEAQGETGTTPDISIGTVTTVEPGTPAAATMTGTPEAPVLNLTIPKGVAGDTPAFTVGEVTTGQPGTPVVVTITGTAAAPVLNIQIPQGLQGNTGSSVEYPYELVNNLTTNDATKGLSAAQGKVLKDELTQLEAEVHQLSGVFYGFFDEESDLPEVENVGYAFVGNDNPLYIYSFDGEEWVNTGVPAQVSIGVSSATASVDANTGTPSVSVSLENGVLSFVFHNLKGAQGNSGYTGAVGELQVVNNLTAGGATDALSAEMGKTLAEYIDEINAKIGEMTPIPTEEEDVPLSRNGYYTGSGQFNSSTKSNTTELIPLEGVMSILYTGSMGGTCASWFNSARSFISQSLTSNGATLEEVEVLTDKPANAAYVALSSRNSTADTPPSSTPEVTVISGGGYVDLQTQINTLAQEVENVDISPDNIAFSKNGYYANNTGAFTSSTKSNSTELVEMAKYKRLIMSGSGNAILSFFNSSRSFIKQVFILDIIGGTNSSFEPNIAGIDLFLYAPSNAAYVGVSVRNSTHETPPKATASLLGYKDYQSDFVRLGVIADGSTDCTDALQKVLYSCGSEISFPRGTYVISDSLIVNTSIVKMLNGNGARIKVTQDVPAFIVTGELGSSFTANPNELSAKGQQSSANTIISGLDIFASSGSSGVGIQLKDVFAVSVQNCYIHGIGTGIEVKSKCRNIIVAGNNIYNCTNYGLLFASSSNCHQANIYGNHISYSKCCVGFIQTAQTANVQLVGNDIEISTVPSGTLTTHRCIVIDYQGSGDPLFSEIEIVGNTIQGHEQSDGLVDISGVSASFIQNLAFVGNQVGNVKSGGYGIKLSCVHNFASSSNTFRRTSVAYYITGDVSVATMTGDVAERGVFINTENTAKVYSLSLVGLTGRSTSGTNNISCDTLNGLVVSGCNLNNGSLTIAATTLDYVSVTGNIFRGTYTIGTCTHRVVENNL